MRDRLRDLALRKGRTCLREVRDASETYDKDDDSRRWIAAIARRDEAVALGQESKRGESRFGSNTTVAEFAKWWLDNKARHRVRSSSLDRKAQRVGRLGEIGEFRLVDVTTEDLIIWQSALSRHSRRRPSPIRVRLRGRSLHRRENLTSSTSIPSSG